MSLNRYPMSTAATSNLVKSGSREFPLMEHPRCTNFLSRSCSKEESISDLLRTSLELDRKINKFDKQSSSGPNTPIIPLKHDYMFTSTSTGTLLDSIKEHSNKFNKKPFKKIKQQLVVKDEQPISYYINDGENKEKLKAFYYSNNNEIKKSSSQDSNLSNGYSDEKSLLSLANKQILSPHQDTKDIFNIEEDFKIDTELQSLENGSFHPTKNSNFLEMKALPLASMACTNDGVEHHKELLESVGLPFLIENEVGTGNLVLKIQDEKKVKSHLTDLILLIIITIVFPPIIVFTLPYIISMLLKHHRKVKREKLITRYLVFNNQRFRLEKRIYGRGQSPLSLVPAYKLVTKKKSCNSLEHEKFPIYYNDIEDFEVELDKSTPIEENSSDSQPSCFVCCVLKSGGKVRLNVEETNTVDIATKKVKQLRTAFEKSRARTVNNSHFDRVHDEFGRKRSLSWSHNQFLSMDFD
ncbi:hypothetical protein ABK040_002579 [Willaertia magna]